MSDFEGVQTTQLNRASKRYEPKKIIIFQYPPPT